MPFKKGVTWKEMYGIERANELKILTSKRVRELSKIQNYRHGIWEERYGIKKANEMKKSLSEKMSKIRSGKKLSEEHKKNVGLANIGRKVSNETRKKISLSLKGHPNWNTELKNCFQKGNSINKGENHPGFKNWASREPYGKAFSPELKEQIRKRDKYTCQECGFHKDQLKSHLNVHHIDYNKRNNNLNNLITLCKSCHTKTNWEREDWIKYFQSKLRGDF